MKNVINSICLVGLVLELTAKFAFAQGYPVSYNSLLQPKTILTSHFEESLRRNNNPSCFSQYALSANGYGQWTNSNNGKSWVLWGNDPNDYSNSNPNFFNPKAASPTGTLTLQTRDLNYTRDYMDPLKSDRANVPPLTSGRNNFASYEGGIVINSPNYPENIGDIMQNHWRSGNTVIQPAGTSNSLIGNVTYNPLGSHDYDDYWNYITGSVSCGGGSFKAGKSDKQLSVDILSEDSCYELYLKGTSLEELQSTMAEAYDTFVRYIATCHDEPAACRAFIDLSNTVTARQDQSLFLPFREYLKSVLYLSSNDCYYCEDVEAIGGTFIYRRDGLGEDFNAQVAVLDYLNSLARCADTSLNYYRNSARVEQHEEWADTVRDSLLTPLDTTLPSLNSLGLGLLIKDGVAGLPSMLGKEILSFRASENPFRRSTEIEFELESMDVAQLEIYDLLGKLVWSSDRSALNAGTHSMQVTLSDAPSGSYYARLSTGNGDVRTLKIEIRE